jgi:hypothetical protein
MIQPKELRIGNHIGLNLKEFPHNYFTVVELAETNAVVTGGLDWHPLRDREYFDPQDFEGIPLDSSLLIRAGFTDVTASDDLNAHYEMALNGFIIHFEVVPSGLCYCFLSMIGIDCDKLHTLQNLVYAISGKELVIKD